MRGFEDVSARDSRIDILEEEIEVPHSDAQEVDEREAAQQDVEADEDPWEVDRLELEAEHEGHYLLRISARPIVYQSHDQPHRQDIHLEEVASNLFMIKIKEWREKRVRLGGRESVTEKKRKMTEEGGKCEEGKEEAFKKHYQ